MSDLIDRQQAIEAVQNRHMMLSKEKVLLINDIEKLPSTQPTFDAMDTQYNLPIGTDLISRQQAIDALDEYFGRIAKLKRRGLNKGEKAISLDVVGAIKTLPSARPKRGKWIDRGEHGDWEWQADGRGKHWHEWECNTCHHYFAERSFFCPHCGVDMREETT